MNSKRVFAVVMLVCTALACGASDFPKWKPRITVAVGGSPRALSYSPDGKLLAIGGTDGTLTIISADSASVVKSLSSGLKSILQVQFLPKSGRLLACGGNNELRVLSMMDWTVVGQAQGIRACQVSEDEKMMVGGDGKTDSEALVLWDVSDLRPIRRQLFSNGARPVDPSFVIGGKVAVAVSRVTYLVDVNTGQATKVQQLGDRATALKIEKGQGDQAVMSLGSLQDDDAPTHRVTSSRDGSLIALGRGWFGQPDFVDVWTATDMKRVVRIKEQNTGTESSISFNNQLVAVGASKPGIITVYRIKDKKKTCITGSNLFQFNPTSLELAVIQDGVLSFYVPTN
ncbi:MAG TPA: WD40 repeat domain-containing protein [Terriglobales bacterium]|nr:WD40 repeat domain-containing protein [Terriglobales bacterium]